MSNLRAILFVVTCVFAVACGSMGDDPTEDGLLAPDEFDPEGKADGSNQNMRTHDPNAAMWQGYDPIFDRVTENSCLGVDAEIEASGLTIKENFRYIRTREMLEEELGVGLSGGGNVGVADANVGLKLLNNFSRSTDSVVLLLRVTGDYSTRRNTDAEGSVSLTENALGHLRSGNLNSFLNECGTHYVNRVWRGAEINVMLTFKSEDKKRLRELEASVEADAMSVPAEGQAEVKQSVERESRDTDISITMDTRGFTLSVDPDEVSDLQGQCKEMFDSVKDVRTDPNVDSDSLLADILASPEESLPDLFQQIDCLKELMRVSLEADAKGCRDSGQCSSVNAAPVGLTLGEYSGLGVEDEMRERLNSIKNDRFSVNEQIRMLADLRARTRAAYWDEIAPFMSAEHKALFAARSEKPEENPVAETVHDLQRIADKWSKEFSPDSTNRGEVERTLTGLLDRCRIEAKSYPYGECGAQDVERIALCQGKDSTIHPYTECGDDVGRVDDVTLVQYVAYVEALLTKYQEEERLLPLQVTIAPQELWFGAHYCEELGSVYRLPRKNELSELELLVSSGPVPGHTTWFSDDENDCKIGAYFEPTADPQIDCSWFGSRGTVCVSSGGLYPSPSAL